MNQTGRTFKVYLDEIPVLLKLEDNRPVEVDKDNPIFAYLGETISPVINIVPALVVRGKENYVFWGNGIQVTDIESEYRRLQVELSEYKQGKSQKKIEKKNISVPKLPVFRKESKQVMENICSEDSIEKAGRIEKDKM